MERIELPEFTDDATDRLAHTLAAFDRASTGEWAITATYNVDDSGETTGLTWGDLREILRRLES